MARTYFRKRIGKGVRTNISYSKSNGFGASLSVGSRNKKGLGWNYNTKSGFTLSLRGTGLRWEFGGGIQGKKGTTRSEQLEAKKNKLAHEILLQIEDLSSKMVSLENTQDSSINTPLDIDVNMISNYINGIKNEINMTRTFHNEEYNLIDLLQDDLIKLHEQFSALITSILISYRNALIHRYLKNLESTKINFSTLIVSLIDMRKVGSIDSFRLLNYDQKDQKKIDDLCQMLSASQLKELDNEIDYYLDIFAEHVGSRLIEIMDELDETLLKSNDIKTNLMCANVIYSIVDFINVYFKNKASLFNKYKNEKIEFHNNLFYFRSKIIEDAHDDLFEFIENGYQVNEQKFVAYALSFAVLLEYIGSNSKVFNDFVPLTMEQSSILIQYEENIISIFADYVMNNIEYFKDIAYDELKDILEINRLRELLKNTFESNEAVINYLLRKNFEISNANKLFISESDSLLSNRLLLTVDDLIKSKDFNSLLDIYGNELIELNKMMLSMYENKNRWMIYTIILIPLFFILNKEKNNPIKYVMYLTEKEKSIEDAHIIAIHRVYTSLILDNIASLNNNLLTLKDFTSIEFFNKYNESVK